MKFPALKIPVVMISLPFEICSSIFSYLTPEELIVLRQCSKWHYFLIGSDLIFAPIARKNKITLDQHTSISALNAYVNYSKSRKRLLYTEPNVIKWPVHLLGVPFISKSPKVGWDGNIVSHIKSEGQYFIEKSIFCGPIDAISIPKNSQYAVLGSKGSTRIHIHYIPSKVLFPIELDQPINAIDHSDAYILAAGISKLFIWDNAIKARFQTIPILNICFVRFINSSSFLTISKLGTITLWSIEKSKSFEKMNEFELGEEVICAQVDPIKYYEKAHRIFCGFKNGTVRQIDLSIEGFRENERMESHGSDWVSSICSIGALRLVLIGTWDNQIRVHDFEGNLKRVWKVNSTPLSIYCDEEASFIVGGYDGALTRYSF